MGRIIVLAAALALCAGAVVAQQAVPAPTYVVDFGPLVEKLVQLAAVVVAALATWLGAWLQSRVKNKDAQALIAKAAENAAVYAQGEIARAGEGLAARSKVEVHSAAVAKGAEYLTTAAADSLKRVGATPAQVEQLVSAQLTRLDPTVHTEPTSPTAPAAVAVAVAPPAVAVEAPKT